MDVDLLRTIAMALLLVWPPYIANATPVVVAKFIRGTPVDLGRNFIDGRRLLGDGKTFEGFIAGIAVGFLGGELTYLLTRLYLNVELPSPLTVLLMCIGALLGDMAGAFIKRRMGLPRGAPVPLLDQLDFLLASLLVLWLMQPSLVRLSYVAVAVVITPPIHLLTNYLAHRVKLKGEPW
jgi:CDP-2,3-bis-(O-geranylgeranyl)-sn-glycerol synthase